MTKRRYEPKRAGGGGEKVSPEPVRITAPMTIAVRCLWHTRLVIQASRTLTGKRYVFEPGEVKTIPAIDAERLLVMEKRQPPGCCGGDPHPPALKYFEVA